jgi:hypothetical protein
MKVVISYVMFEYCVTWSMACMSNNTKDTMTGRRNVLPGCGFRFATKAGNVTGRLGVYQAGKRGPSARVSGTSLSLLEDSACVTDGPTPLAAIWTGSNGRDMVCSVCLECENL